MNWTPLHLHSHYSLLDGLSKPHQIAKVCADQGFSSCALTDHGNISGAVQITRALRDVGVKPILGNEFYIANQDATVRERASHHLVVLAKNYKGWLKLIEATSNSNSKEFFYYKPRLDLERLAGYCGDLIAFSGHPGSLLGNLVFKDNSAYNMKNPQDHVHADAVNRIGKQALYLQEIFGKGNFFIEIQLIDQDSFKPAGVIGKVLREVSIKFGIPCVATADSHYPTQADAVDQRVLLCSSLKTTFSKVMNSIGTASEFGLSTFFKSKNYHIPSYEEMAVAHTDHEIQTANEIADMCEEYDILSTPRMPQFDCPGGLSQPEYMKELCRKGWSDKLHSFGVVKDDTLKEEYKDRFLSEFGVIEKAGLSGYFLVVQDYVNWAKKKGWLMGPGRGSAAGSLVSYLLGITNIDPIPHDLLFSRFYNEGRNTADRVSLPDIDIDCPVEKRGEIIDYLKLKYGENNVAQICTFGRLQGKSALKEVLRVHEACGFDMMNQMTKFIPAEQEIADLMKDSGETSIINWSLENDPQHFQDWCRKEDDGTLVGEFSEYFKQAIRIEGTYKSMGKHAAGVVISVEDLNTVCPMIKEKKGSDKMTAWEMNDLEAGGHVKFDLLGVAILDKLMGVNELLKNGCFDE